MLCIFSIMIAHANFGSKSADFGSNLPHLQLQLASASVAPFWTETVDEDDHRNLLRCAKAAGFRLVDSRQFWEANVAEPAELMSHMLYLKYAFHALPQAVLPSIVLHY